MIDALAEAMGTAGIAGWVWLGALVTSAIASIAVLVVARGRATVGAGLTVVTSVMALGALAGAWAATISLASWARSRVLGGASGMFGIERYAMIHLDIVMVTIAPVALFVLTALAFSAVAVAWSRTVRPIGAAWALAGSLAAPLFVALIQVLGWGADVRATFARLASVAGSDQTRLIAEELPRAHERWLSGQFPIAVTAAVAVAIGAVAAVVAARAGTRAGWPNVAGAVLLFVGGLAAFSSTRGHAADARLVMPRHVSSIVDQDLRETPHDATCRGEPEIAPVLSVAPDAVRLDGRSVDPETLEQDLETMKRNWGILHPGRPLDPYPLILVLPSEARLPALDAYFEAASRAGVDLLYVVAHRVVVLETATRGSIEVVRPCFVAVRLGGDGATSTREVATARELVERVRERADFAITPGP